MLAVDVSDDREGTEAFYSENGFEIPAAFDTAEVAYGRYRIAGTPTSYLVDADGTILWRHFGYLPGDEVSLRERLETLLGDS